MRSFASLRMTDLGGNKVRYAKKAMIVAPQPEPTEAGADVLREGGNAVDAGIACALVQGVVDPMMCGIAGFGSCGIYMPGKKFHGYIDAHAPAPLGARPDMWANLIESEARDGYGFILKRPRQRHRLQVDLRAGEPQNVLRGAQGARQPAMVAHRRARHRLGRERLDRAAACPLLVVGRRRLRPRAQSRAHPLHAGRPRALLPARRQPQARRRPRRQSRLWPGTARHRQGRRRRLLFR